MWAVAAEWIPVALGVVAGAGGATWLSRARQHSALGGIRRELSDEQDQTARLRAADDVKNTFLAAVSHEIRTPLTSVLGFAITLQDRPDLPTAQRAQMLTMLVQEAQHLEEILANLLDLDRLTRGKATLVPTPTDPADVVLRVVERIERRSGRSIVLRIEGRGPILVDDAKLERIVENLVGNAVKYTGADVEVEVLVDGTRSGVTLQVDDAGPGMSPELRAVAFEPFQRGAGETVPGTGIGLSLVDRFARMHGGRALVKDRPGGGCRFQVHLPSVDSARRRTGSGGAPRKSRLV